MRTSNLEILMMAPCGLLDVYWKMEVYISSLFSDSWSEGRYMEYWFYIK